MTDEIISTTNYDSIEISRNAYIKDQMNVTDDELIYLNRLLKLQCKMRELLFTGNIPSMILEDFLYQGDIQQATNQDLLKNLGIRHIINICNSRLPKSITENFNVLWINILDDLKTNIEEYFKLTNEFLYSCKNKNEKVLVHCHMGISRSSTIVLAYLIKYHHDTLIEAYDYLLNRHLFAAPNYGFFLQLIRYEKELQKGFRLNS